MQLVMGNDGKFLEPSANETGRVDGFRSADFQDIENIQMDEEYNFIQTDAEIENTADSDSQIEPNHVRDTEESISKNESKLTGSLTIKEEGELNFLNTEANEKLIAMEDKTDEMEIENDKTATTDDDESQLRNLKARLVHSFGNSKDKMGNSSKI